MKSVLLCPPTYFEVRDVKNPHMQPGQLPDLNLAHQQWQALAEAFTAAGVEVHLIEPQPDLEDMVFAANQVFAGKDAAGRKFIVRSRMKHASRQREVPFYTAWFAGHGYEVVEVDLNGECLEGHGDLLWHGNFSRVWAGHGFRSTASGVARFAQAMAVRGIAVTPLELVHPSFYHLDTCLAPLNAEAALVCPEALSPASLDRLRAGWARLYEVPAQQAMGFICNGIAVNGRFLTPRLTPQLEEILAREGLQPVVLPTTEFEKSGGSLFCLKCFTDW